MKIKFEFLTVVLLSLLLLAACSEKALEDSAEKQAEDVEDESSNDVEVNDDEKQKVEFDIPGADAPEDQGEMNIWYKGEVMLDGRKLTVGGFTNLLPESKLYFLIEGVEAGIIGGNL